MKNIISFCFFCVLAATSLAQKETFDLVTYKAPSGSWQKEVTAGATGYTSINKNNNNWCRIFIMNSIISKGSVEKDFESEWQDLIVKNYKPAGKSQPGEVREAGGWKIKSGTTTFTFNNRDAIAMLTTMSGFNRCISIVATTNSQDYLKDIDTLLSSVDLKKPDAGAKNDTALQKANSNVVAVLGTWRKTGSVNPDYHDAYATSIAGYTTDQYTFAADGSYNFISKTFRMSYDKILLIRESGSYQVSGNNIMINPKKSVIEAWSKKEGVDKFGKLLSTQQRTLEKVTYTFTKYYFSGIDQWNFVLQADKSTQRDGPFSNNKTFVNAWYYSPISTNNPVIEIPVNQ